MTETKIRCDKCGCEILQGLGYYVRISRPNKIHSLIIDLCPGCFSIFKNELYEFKQKDSLESNNY